MDILANIIYFLNLACSLLPFSPSTSLADRSSVGVVVSSLDLTSIPQVMSTSSSTVVTQSTNNYVTTCTTTTIRLSMSQCSVTTGGIMILQYRQQFKLIIVEEL